MNKYRIFLIALIMAHFGLFLATGLFRHWGFLTSINDLANFDQAIWGTIQGSLLLNTDVFDMPISRLAIHFDPIQLVFVPFYLFYPTVAWLTAGQALALSITAWPIYILASRIFESEKMGLVWALIFLVNPFLLNAAAWDFHPITLAVPFVALGLLAVESKNFKIMLFCALVILLCKEHLGVMIIGFGILWWIRTRQWIPGTALVLLGAAHFYLVLQVIMPAFSPTGQHVMVSEGLGQLSRYAWLGDSVGDIVRTLITQPIYVLKTVLISMAGLGYLVLLLIPFLFFPLLGLIYLLPGMADLAANMLSANPMPRSPIAYHSAALIPIFTAAAVYGIRKISRWQKRFSVKELTGLVLITSLLIGYAFAPFPFPGAKNVWSPASFVSLPDSRVQEIRSLVGKDASLSVQANIGAHFSQREGIYRYPNRVNDVDAIVLWLDSPTKNIHTYPEDDVESRQYIIGMLDSHLSMDREDYFASVEELLVDEDYGVIYWDNPWLVLKRNVEGKEVDTDVMVRLEELREKWL